MGLCVVELLCLTVEDTKYTSSFLMLQTVLEGPPLSVILASTINLSASLTISDHDL